MSVGLHVRGGGDNPVKLAQPPAWLVFAFSALGAGDPGDEFAHLLVGLFDAIMSTFTWTWTQEPGEPDGHQGTPE